MATVSNAPGIPLSRVLTPSYNNEDENLSTLPDPRSRTISPANEPGCATPSQHPDLSNEITTLSNKLINAINQQTSLDDTLTATRHELEASRERVRQLERENAEHKSLLSNGTLIRSSVADAEKNKLLATLADERKKRGEVEKSKKSIEQELENLTTALFEEANKMVSTTREQAQKEYEIVNKKNEQLKAQLQEAENLLKSQQQQLVELKQVMEHMSEQDDQTNQTNGTAPSTPALYHTESKDHSAQNSDSIQSSLIPEPVSPSFPTSFTHLIQPVLRTDLGAYDDFISLLRMSKNVVTGSRVSSGSYGAIGLGLGLGAYTGLASQAPNNGSTSSLSTLGTFGSSPATPTTPASTVSTGSNNGPNSQTPLKDTKFYKRALAEDIEPTLRLDNAPGLSWLARRNVLNAVCEGTLVVEPMPASTKAFAFPCSLCGENRKDAEHVRSHRFRTSENDNAQRYPLCLYCLGRVRSTCGFMSFLRVLKEGHWRGEDEESDKAAWEESVRLRERMFWCRIGGGVIPSLPPWHQDSSRSPRASEDERRRKLSEDSEIEVDIVPKDITPTSELSPISISGTLNKRLAEGDISPSPLRAELERSDAGNADSKAEDRKEPENATASPIETTGAVPKTTESVPDATKESIPSIISPQIEGPEENCDETKSLSVAIPGSFE
ncbi:rab guanine nucleotide exchange factor S2 [Clarireedia jacksonii]